MRQHELSPAPGSKRKRKRVGRGTGSGHGTYSGRGCKGQKSRSGDNRSRSFEGGQLSLVKRLPQKRGFTNIFKTQYSIVNLDRLNIFDPGSEVTPQELLSAGVVKSLRYPIKVLAKGSIDRNLSIRVNKFSAAAKTKIEAAGGKAEELGHAAEAS